MQYLEVPKDPRKKEVDVKRKKGYAQLKEKAYLKDHREQIVENST